MSKGRSLENTDKKYLLSQSLTLFSIFYSVFYYLLVSSTYGLSYVLYDLQLYWP